MDFSSIRLVVADMDGTLLNSSHELPAHFYEVYDKLKAKGILFAAASGRQYFNILNKFPGLEDEILFIAENGAYVVHRGEDLLVQAMDKEIARQQIREAKMLYQVYPILCGKKYAYVDNDTPEFVEKLNLYYDSVKSVPDILEVDDDDFLKIALCDLNGAEHNSYRYFSDRQDILQIKVSGKTWLDLSDPLANKGKALQYMQRRLGISRDETMAFGDYLNDVELMQEAGFSYAMENAHAEVKKVARYHTASNDQDGVLKVLNQLIG